jgi:hypothetical protein
MFGKKYTFDRKYKNTAKTIHIRIPTEYKELVVELLQIFDERFEIEKGKNLLRKYIDNFK